MRAIGLAPSRVGAAPRSAIMVRGAMTVLRFTLRLGLGGWMGGLALVAVSCGGAIAPSTSGSASADAGAGADAAPVDPCTAYTDAVMGFNTRCINHGSSWMPPSEIATYRASFIAACHVGLTQDGVSPDVPSAIVACA